MSEQTKEIDALKFREQCLALLDELTPEGLVVTKHGKKVARVIPYPRSPAEMIGSLRDQIEVKGDLFSTRLNWNVNDQT